MSPQLTHTQAPTTKSIAQEQIQRRRIILKAILVGIVAGTIAGLFRMTLAAAEGFRVFFHQNLDAWGVGPLGQAIIMISFCVVGAGTSVWLVQRFAPEAAGSGIPHLKSVIIGQQKFRWKRLLPVKFVAGAIGIGTGLALGREGPTVQMGGAAGNLVSDALRIKPESTEQKVLISAGSAAGLSAAFNAPLAALMFVMEELYGTLTPVVFVASFLAAVSADIVSQMMLGGNPIFQLETVSLPSFTAATLSVTVSVAVVLGVICGLLGVAFNISLLKTLDLFDSVQRRLKRSAAFVPGVIVGGMVGIVYCFVPGLVGSGGDLTEQVLDREVSVRLILIFLAVRFFLTLVSYGCGAAGGIFTPILVIGALAGFMVGQAANMVLLNRVAGPEIFAVIAMGALFTAVVRAPLTGIVLIVELTGKYEFILPLLICSLTAYGVAEYLRVPPIYEALRQRSQKTSSSTPDKNR